MGEWSHARVYWDLTNAITDRYTIDYVDWSRHFSDLDWRGLSTVYQAILIDMNTVLEHLNFLFFEPEIRAKILPINHGPQQVADYTFQHKQSSLKKYVDRTLLERDLDLFKLIACVSPNTVHATKKEVPLVSSKLRLTTLGVNPANFPLSTFTRTQLKNVGYFTHIDATPFQGFNTKRGYLAQAACQLTKLPLVTKSNVNFRFMDLWYQKVDAYLMTSIYESGPLPLLEAGVCGIPVIAAPAGLAPQFLQNGGGVLSETFDEEEYLKTACNTLQFWQYNPEALRRESVIIRENTLAHYSWDVVKSQWAAAINEFIEQ
jgi:hypothetical protein